MYLVACTKKIALKQVKQSMVLLCKCTPNIVSICSSPYCVSLARWLFGSRTNIFLVFRYNTKDYCFQQTKPQLDAYWSKSTTPHPPPPFLPFGVILGSHYVMWCDVHLQNHISCIIEHLMGPGRRAPHSQTGKNCETQSIHFMKFAATLLQLVLPFCERHHICGIPMVPILQIHTQISPIWISSLGPQLCQLFKILIYTELQDTRSCCRWKA